MTAPSASPGSSADADIPRLFTVPPGEFVNARDALAAELKRAGRAAEAADVKRLRKPTPVVWVINRVARQHPDAVARFIDTVDRLKRAHFGEPGLLTQATEEHRAALEALVDRAPAALADAGLRASVAVTGRMAATLLGLAADPDARAELGEGRVTHERQAPGFEALTGTAATGRPLRGASPRRPRARPAARQDHDAVNRAHERHRAAETAVQDAARRVEESERLAARHGHAAEAARREAQTLKERLREVERRARDERRAAQAAARAVRQARRDRERSEAARTAAEQALDAATRRRRG